MRQRGSGKTLPPEDAQKRMLLDGRMASRGPGRAVDGLEVFSGIYIHGWQKAQKWAIFRGAGGRWRTQDTRGRTLVMRNSCLLMKGGVFPKSAGFLPGLGAPECSRGVLCCPERCIRKWPPVTPRPRKTRTDSTPGRLRAPSSLSLCVQFSF